MFLFINRNGFLRHQIPINIVTTVISFVVMTFCTIGFGLFTHYHWADIKRTICRKKDE